MSARSPRSRGRAKLLIVDDHPVVRQGLRQLLEQQPGISVAGEAENAREALAALKRLRVDLLICDLALGEHDGLDLIKSVCGAYPRLPVLVLSMHEESFYAERVIRAGARGYIMKQEAPEKLLAAVRRILAGDVYLSERVAPKVLTRLSGRGAAFSSPIGCLSDRELEIFQFIGAGYGTQEIAEKLTVSTKTVETHRQHIKEKLRLSDASELLRYAIQWGRGGRAF